MITHQMFRPTGRRPGFGRVSAVAVAGLLVVALAMPAFGGGRYESYMRRAEEGPHVDTIAATYFGTDSHEEFLTAAGQSDGTIVAFGNAWGPEFPRSPRPTVLGQGTHRGLNPYERGDSDRDLDRSNPDIAGMIVRYSEDLSSVESITRFDWGVGTITDGLVTEDDNIVITGRATRAISALAQRAPRRATVRRPDDEDGSYSYKDVDLPGHGYVAQLSPDGRRLQWIVLLEGHGQPRGIYFDHQSDIIVDSRGLWRIAADGSDVIRIEGAERGGRMLGVSPDDGKILRGGQNNPGTGREPWWRPYVNCFSADGEHLWEIYAWDGRLVGHDHYRLVSDSYVRGGTWDAEGNILLLGSSDGGNSVYTRHPIDLDRNVDMNNYGMSSWGMRVGQASYILRIDPDNFDVLAKSTWLSFVPNNFESAGARNRPNSIWIHHVQPLPGGHIGIAGRSATGLIETPNAWYQYPQDGSRFGTDYVSIFSKDVDHLYFSSYTPGLNVKGLGAASRGLVVVGRATEADSDGNEPPVKNAIQENFAGGEHDAHIILMEAP